MGNKIVMSDIYELFSASNKESFDNDSLLPAYFHLSHKNNNFNLSFLLNKLRKNVFPIQDILYQ